MTTPHHSEPAREAVADLLSHLKLYVMEKLEPDDADMLHDRMSNVTAAFSASPAPAASGGLEAVREAAKDIIASRSSTYKARNGRVMSIEDGAGEMMWIVPFDEMHALEAALAAHAATGGEAVAWRWRFRDDNPNAPWSFAAKIEDVMGIDILSEPLYAYPAPSETATGGEADPDRLLKDALFANIKAGRETAGYSGVKVDGGRIASIYFAKHDAGTSLRLAHPAPSETGVKAWQDVRDERRRQVEAEGWTPEHDDAHTAGEMARAAAVYALCSAESPPNRAVMDEFGQYNSVPFKVRNQWPWDEKWLKPKDRRCDLVRAGALILAEIERLDRAALEVRSDG